MPKMERQVEHITNYADDDKNKTQELHHLAEFWKFI